MDGDKFRLLRIITCKGLVVLDLLAAIPDIALEVLRYPVVGILDHLAVLLDDVVDHDAGDALDELRLILDLDGGDLGHLVAVLVGERALVNPLVAHYQRQIGIRRDAAADFAGIHEVRRVEVRVVALLADCSADVEARLELLCTFLYAFPTGELRLGLAFLTLVIIADIETVADSDPVVVGHLGPAGPEYRSGGLRAEGHLATLAIIVIAAFCNSFPGHRTQRSH